ncbi:MAG: hypothetical protein HRT54_21655 [Colwellia sp.]|nr:hypothetical protein [Colwellia sp.]
MKVQLSDGPLVDNIYFEVWVLDTLTGEVFMCDPIIVVTGGNGSTPVTDFG